MLRSLKWVSAVLAVVVTFAAVTSARAGEVSNGIVRSTGENQIVVADEQGKEWRYTLADQALMICPETKDARVTDFKPGAKVSVLSEKKGDGYVAHAILHRDGAYRDAALGAGKVKNVADMAIVITDEKAKDWTYSVTDQATIRLKNKDANLNAFKAGDTVVFVYGKSGERYHLLSLCDCPKQ